MPEFAGLGTTLVLIVAVVLWVAYLVPVWTRKREYLATERNAIRLQQTLRIMAESAEAPEEVQLEADARTIAVQQKAVAKEARLKQAMEHAKAVARARELDDQIKAVEREVRAAVKSTVSRSQRLRRTRLACFALVLVAVAAVVAGAIVPGLQVLLAVGGAVAVLGVVGLVAVNGSSTRMRRVAEATAPQVKDLVEAREVAAQAVASEERMAQQVLARQATRGEVLQTEEVLASRAWTPQSVPEQRVRAQYEPARHPSDDLLARARAQLAEDRRAISGPIARVSQLEPSFEEIIDGEEPAAGTGLRQAQEPLERRLAPTQPATPIREIDLGRGSRGVAQVAPAARRDQALDAAAALDVTRADAPIETAPDEHRLAEHAPAAAASKFASMGRVDAELAGMDVHEAFLRRVG
ncbi:hypothetical protein [Agrococcus baldri]|uniref:Large exoprotein n=1 Tax=Agrococcus baldri TaxID=153730 RepID=A0AA87RHW9_9MICO|nr:hypothetical protein [Agrococcus baldri]GEK79728.1 hypothetical protein ABA31_10790 [Agrococcus baldri]